MSALTLFIMLFIFRNSLQDAQQSSLESDFVLRIVKGILEFFRIDYTAWDLGFGIRKIAHFTEFFVFGVSLYMTLYTYKVKNLLRCIIVPVSGLLVAITDEFIQRFSAGRASMFSDVLIDLTGVVFAVLIFGLIFYFVNRKKDIKDE